MADSITLTDSSAKYRLLLQQYSDALTISATHSRLRGKVRPFPDNLTLSSSTSRLMARLKTIADSLSFADISLSAKIKLRGVSDSLSFTSSAANIRTKIRTVLPTLTLSIESISKITTRLRTIGHSISLTGSFLGFAGNVKFIFETLSFTDSPTRLTTRLRTLSDSLSFVDSVTRLKNRNRSIADSITISSSLSRITNRLRTFFFGPNTITLTDSITRIRSLNQTVTDSLSLTDSIIKIKGKIGLISNSLTLSSTHSRIVSRIKTVAVDSLVLTDSISRIRLLLQTITSDSISFNDLITKIKGETKTIANSLTLTDSLVKRTTRLRTISVTLSISELISKFTRRFKTFAEFMNLVSSTIKLPNGGIPVPSRFYFHSTFYSVAGILPTTNQSSMAVDYNVDLISNSRTMDRTRSTTLQKSLSKSISSAWFTTSNYYITRFISPILGQFSIAANTWKYSISAVNTSSPSTDKAPTRTNTNPGPIHINVYVWRPSTGAKIGTIYDGDTSNVAQYSDSNQRTAYATFAGSAVNNMQQTDVLVVECWMHIYNSFFGSQTPTFYFDGTTVNTTDGAVVSNHAAFLETPESFSFSILKHYARDISTSISFLASAPIRLRGFIQTVVSPSLSLSDTTTKTRYRIRTLLPTLTLSESITRHKPIVFKNITDTISLISDHARFKTKTRTISDSLLFISSLYRGIKI